MKPKNKSESSEDIELVWNYLKRQQKEDKKILGLPKNSPVRFNVGRAEMATGLSERDLEIALNSLISQERIAIALAGSARFIVFTDIP